MLAALAALSLLLPPPGPLGSVDVAVTVQGGPIGAAQTYTIDGTLTFRVGSGPISKNMFDSSDAGSPADAAFGQFVPSGTYGNQDGATGGPIGDVVEFASRFAARGDIEGTFATAINQSMLHL
jgi:hypothetical protein